MQDVENRVSAQSDSRVLQQVVQLARAYVWLMHALLSHQLHHRLRIREAIGLAAPALVVRLTAVAHSWQAVFTLNPAMRFLREDLHKGFFTTRTP